MSEKITEEDMDALAELIREKGYTVYKVYDIRKYGNFSFKAVKENGKGHGYYTTILVGQYGGMFIADGYLPGFPMSRLDKGGEIIKYQIAL